MRRDTEKSSKNQEVEDYTLTNLPGGTFLAPFSYQEFAERNYEGYLPGWFLRKVVVTMLREHKTPFAAAMDSDTAPIRWRHPVAVYSFWSCGVCCRAAVVVSARRIESSCECGHRCPRLPIASFSRMVFWAVPVVLEPIYFSKKHTRIESRLHRSKSRCLGPRKWRSTSCICPGLTPRYAILWFKG